jgi:hypothetical protein
MNNFFSTTILKFILFSGVLSLFLLASCRPKPIKINVESAPEKLVIYTQLIPDKSIIVSLTHTFSALEGVTEANIESLLVSGAQVQVKFNGETFDFQEITPGIYISYNEAYQYNQEYELTITSGSEVVTAKTMMLPKVDFTTCLPQVDKFPTDTNVYVNVAFSDIPNVNNWYLINVYRKTGTFNPLDGLNFFQTGNNSSLTTLLVSDKEFNGTYEKKVALENLFHNDSIAVTVSNINEKYFDYLKARSAGGGNVFTQLNLEPISYPTNVVNGYGFFNAHFPDIKLFDLGQF